jgi:hypothetical protein
MSSHSFSKKSGFTYLTLIHHKLLVLGLFEAFIEDLSENFPISQPYGITFFQWPGQTAAAVNQIQRLT